jgi:hypothetical protein
VARVRESMRGGLRVELGDAPLPISHRGGVRTLLPFQCTMPGAFTLGPWNRDPVNNRIVRCQLLIFHTDLLTIQGKEDGNREWWPRSGVRVGND